MSTRGQVSSFLNEFNLRDALLGGYSPLIHDERTIKMVKVSRLSSKFLSLRPCTYFEGMKLIYCGDQETFLFFNEQGQKIGRYDAPPPLGDEGREEADDFFTVIPRIVNPSEVHSVVSVRHNFAEDDESSSWPELISCAVIMYKPAKRTTMATLITEELQRRSNIQRRRSFQKS